MRAEGVNVTSRTNIPYLRDDTLQLLYTEGHYAIQEQHSLEMIDDNWERDMIMSQNALYDE